MAACLRLRAILQPTGEEDGELWVSEGSTVVASLGFYTIHWNSRHLGKRSHVLFRFIVCEEVVHSLPEGLSCLGHVQPTIRTEGERLVVEVAGGG